MKLLERGPTQIRLSHCLHEAAGGEGRLIFLGGEAGIGKSALVREFGSRVGESVRLVSGACDPLSTPRPLGPLFDMQARLGRRFADRLASDSDANSLFRDFLEECSGDERATVVVIEDVHWADEATLDLLRFVGRRIGGARLLLIATYRDDEVLDTHPLRVVLGDLATAPDVRRLKLDRLSLDAVRTLAAGTPTDPVRLHRETGGNPFYVSEVIAAGGSGIPPTVRDAVLARAARLPAPARKALDAAAVLGLRFEPWLWQSVANPTAEALDACLGSGMLIRDEDRLAFRHELAREALLDALPNFRQQELHRRALDTLRSSAARIDLGRLAHHAEGAADAESVLAYAPAAARAAAAVSAHREAAAHYAQALRFAAEQPLERRAELLESAAYEYYLTDQIGPAIDARRAALELRRRSGDRAREGDDLRWLSRLSWFAGDAAEAERTGRLAIEVLESGNGGAELAMAYSNWAQLRMLAHDTSEAIRWGERAISVATKLGATETLIHALNNVGTARLHAGDETGIELLDRSLRLSLESSLEEHAARAYTNLASSCVAQFRLADAEPFLRDGIEYATEHDLDSWRLYMIGWRAVARMYQGRWAEATTDAMLVSTHPNVSPISEIQALVVLGRISTRAGRTDAATHLDRALELAEHTGELQRLGPVRAARAEAAWLQGDPERTREETDAALALAREHRHAWLAGELCAWRARAGLRTDPPEWIAKPFALEIAGQWNEAAREWRRRGCPYEAALAQSEFPDAEVLRNALEEFRRLGARPAARATIQRLRGLGVRGIPAGPRASTQRNPAGLTKRQLQVLRLVVEGLTDRQIAGRLFISPKTVGHHVSAVLTKLQVRTRAEAVREAIHRRIVEDRESVSTR